MKEAVTEGKKNIYIYDSRVEKFESFLELCFFSLQTCLETRAFFILPLLLRFVFHFRRRTISDWERVLERKKK